MKVVLRIYRSGSSPSLSRPWKTRARLSLGVLPYPHPDGVGRAASLKKYNLTGDEIAKSPALLAEIAVVAHVGTRCDREQRLVYGRYLEDNLLWGHAADSHYLASLLTKFGDGLAVSHFVLDAAQDKSFSRIGMSEHSPEGMTVTHAPESTVMSSMIHSPGF